MSEQMTGLTIKGRPISVSELSAMVVPVCFLCHADGIDKVGVFFPNPDHAVRLVAHTVEAMGPVQGGMGRIMVYGLCAECMQLGEPIIAEMVEAKVFTAGGVQ